MSAVGLLDVARRVARTGEPQQKRNVPATGENVSGRIVDVSLVPIGDAVAMTFVDVTEALQAETRLHEMAERDQLTGLWNRPKFRSELSRSISMGMPMIVALLDIDDFKRINETLGHAIGDLLLQILGDRFLSQLPEHWTMARLGGDEFAIAAPGGADEFDAVAERIRAAASRPLLVEGIKVNPSVSIGLASYPEDGAGDTQLLRMADAALRNARQQGIPHWSCTESDRQQSARFAELNRSIGEAFGRGQFVLYAQPFVNLSTYEIIGAEGLARWLLPGTGVLTPNFFLDLLAMSGRSSRLTDFMIERAVGLTAGGRLMSINLSPADLHRADLVASVKDALNQRDPEAGALWLEILEARVFAAGKEMIDSLIDIGVTVAIDDFGAAFSSLTRLAEHDISVLKLDRSLLMALGSNERARRVIRGVVDASHDLGAVVVAEGVETMDACSVVEDLGCNYVQGFLLGRPAPEPMVADLLVRPGALTPSDWPSQDEIIAWEDDHLGQIGSA